MSLRDVYENGFDEECGKELSAEACPECSGDLATEGGEVSCTECGLVVDEYRFDHGPRRTFPDDVRNREQTGPPLTNARHDRGLSSEIGFGSDARGDELSSRKRRQLGRLRTQHNRARWGSKAERNLATACSEIARMTSALDLPRSVREEASVLFRRAQNEDLILGRSIETVAAGCVYAACRVRGIARPIEEVAAVAKCTEDKVTLGFRLLNVEFGLETQIVAVGRRIPRLASECGASTAVERRATELAALAEESGIANGRNPAGVAAACLYLASQETGTGLTQAELAAVANVTTLTLRNRYYELQELVA